MKGNELVHEHWVEVISVCVLLVGFFIALIIRSSFTHYIVILLAGLLGGRVLFDRHRVQPILPFVLIMIGFFLGFMLGSFSANKLVITVLFLLGLFVSYWAHQKGYVGFFKTDGFIK